MPTKAYCTGCTAMRLSTSNRKNTAKVRPINSSAYLIARSVFRYWSTGSTKLTPKLRAVSALQLSPCTQSANASSRLVAKKLVSQCAFYPASDTSRLLGRYSPTKLACGQPEVSSTLQFEVEGVLQHLPPLDVQQRQRRMHTCTEALCSAARGKAQVHAIEAQLQVIADAPDITDADREERPVKLVQTQLITQPQACRQLEGATDLVIAAVQQRFIDAACTLLGAYLAIEHKALWQEVQQATALLLFQVTLASLGVGFPLVPHLGVRHYQNRPGQLLAVAGTARDVLQPLGTLILPLAHQPADHRQRDQQ